MNEFQSGIVIFDKPPKISSAKAVTILKKLYGSPKVGHAGTLDPCATGVLVILLNKATRLSQFLLTGDKTYEVMLKLGQETDTQDFTGTIICEKPVNGLRSETILDVISKFKGDYLQIPPTYSALKHEGVPLYKLARKGKPVVKPPRAVHISHIDIMEIEPPDVLFKVKCSAGTYVRTLCSDIGKILGTGGHMAMLRRTVASGFSLEEAFDIDKLNNLKEDDALENAVIPMTSVLRHMGEWRPCENVLKRVEKGAPVSLSDMGDKKESITAHSDYIKIIDSEDNLLAIAKAEEGENILKYIAVLN